MRYHSRDRRGVLPTFLIIGAMKAGTDSLYQYLRTHPQVSMSRVKELDFFVEELNWRRGPSWYAQQFRDGDSAYAIGEASTSYTKYPTFKGVPARIASVLPDVKLIYVVRDPIQRMRSQYLHEFLMGEVLEPLEIALLTLPRYVEYSSYGVQLAQYLDWFARDQLLVITSEALRSHRTATLKRLYGFLGVDPEWEPPNVEVEFHRTDEKRVARQAFRRVQRWAPYQALSRALPSRAKVPLRKLTTQGIDPASFQLSDALAATLRSRLEDDLVQLREVLGADLGDSPWAATRAS